MGSVVWSSTCPTMRPAIAGTPSARGALGQDVLQHAVLDVECRRLAARELAEGDPGEPGQRAREPQLGEEAVDPIEGLVHVLEEEDGAAEVGEVRRPREVRHQAEIAAEEPALCPARHQRGHAVLPLRLALARLPARGCAQSNGGVRGPENLAQLGEGVGGEAARGDGPVKADQSRLRVQRHVQGGDVAVADERLGIGADEVPVQQRQQAGGAIPAPHAPQRIHRGIREGRLQIRGAVRVRAREVALAIEDVLARTDAEPEGLQGLDRVADPVGLIGRARGGDETDGLARREAPRAEEGQRITSSARLTSESGIGRPSTRAVLRFTTSSNFGGWATGSSEGRAPLRMRST